MINEVRWDITGFCNLDCGHCQAAKYYKEKRKAGNKDLNTDEVKIVIDRLVDSGVKRIGVLGGEPLVRPDIIEILKYMKEKGVEATLNSNLTLLDKFDIDELWNYCTAIFVSIDGTNATEHDRLRGHGTFDKTCKNLERLAARRKNKEINISYVLNHYNYRSAGNIFGLMKQMDIETCFVDVIHKVGNAEDNWGELGLTKEEEIQAIIDIIRSWDFESGIMLNLRMYTNKFRDYLFEKTGVRLNDKLVWDAPGRTSLYILNDGTLLPAHFLAYMDYGKEFVSKSLLNYSIEEIMMDGAFKEFLQLKIFDLLGFLIF